MAKKTGRPQIKIEWEQVYKLCGLHCTSEEIASFLNIDNDTLVNAIKREFNMSFSDFFKKYSATGKISLRRKQFEVAMEGNTSMLIWLGKNHLGQTDSPIIEDEREVTPVNVVFNVVNASQETDSNHAESEYPTE